MAGIFSDCQHWDKIVFTIKTTALANATGFPRNELLDIKVPDDPRGVANLKTKVLGFLDMGAPGCCPDNATNRRAISIDEVEYAIDCSTG